MALNEIQSWREKYKDYPELSEIFLAIDRCCLNLGQMEMLPKAEEAPHLSEPPDPPSLVGIEGKGEKPEFSGAVNDELPSYRNAGCSTDKEGPSADKIGNFKLEGQAAGSGTSGGVGVHQRMCNECRKFKPSPEELGKGTCEKYPNPLKADAP
jgi:hypothetical protein